jgi:hypothetical protein
MPPNEDSDAIPVPGEWECSRSVKDLAILRYPLGVLMFMPEDGKPVPRLKVGEQYRLILVPAYVTVATSDPSPE